MSDIDVNLHYDFSSLVEAALPTLLVQLAETHSALANLSIRIAFLRQEEDRDKNNFHARAARHEMEGLRDAYVEKKWLIVKLLEYRDDLNGN